MNRDFRHGHGRQVRHGYGGQVRCAPTIINSQSLLPPFSCAAFQKKGIDYFSQKD
jgi:hypothetical protein